MVACLRKALDLLAKAPERQPTSGTCLLSSLLRFMQAGEPQ